MAEKNFISDGIFETYFERGATRYSAGWIQSFFGGGVKDPRGFTLGDYIIPTDISNVTYKCRRRKRSGVRGHEYCLTFSLHDGRKIVICWLEPRTIPIVMNTMSLARSLDSDLTRENLDEIREVETLRNKVEELENENSLLLKNEGSAIKALREVLSAQQEHTSAITRYGKALEAAEVLMKTLN